MDTARSWDWEENAAFYHIKSDKLKFTKDYNIPCIEKRKKDQNDLLPVQADTEWRPNLHNITEIALERGAEICSQMNKILLWWGTK